MAEKIYDSSGLYAVFRPGNSSYLLITFGYNGMTADGSYYWGQSFSEKMNLSVLGFVAKTSNWYPKEAMNKAIASCYSCIKPFSKRITYGGSMGGYAALKYSQALGANASISIAPQFSIEPNIVGDFEKKYTEFYVKKIHRYMSIRKSDMALTSIVLFDPNHHADSNHANLIKKAAKRVNLIEMPLTGHATAQVLANTRHVYSIIEAAVNDDIDLVRKMSSEARRTSSLRIAALANAALERHPLWASSIAAKYIERITGSERANLRKKMLKLAEMTEKLLREKAPTHAEPANLGNAVIRSLNHARQIHDWAKTASMISQDDPNDLLRKAGDEAKLGNYTQAISLTKKAISASPRYALLHHRLAGFLIQTGEFSEAAHSAKLAADYDPDNPDFSERLSVVEARLGRYDNAIDAIKRAISCAPSKASLRDKLASFYISSGNLTEAARAAEKAVHLDAEYSRYHHRLAHIAFLAEDEQKMMSEAAEASRLDPNDPSPLQLLAAFHERSGNVQEAMSLLSKAAKISPENRAIYKKLDSLRRMAS